MWVIVWLSIATGWTPVNSVTYPSLGECEHAIHANYPERERWLICTSPLRLQIQKHTRS